MYTKQWGKVLDVWGTKNILVMEIIFQFRINIGLISPVLPPPDHRFVGAGGLRSIL